MRSFSDWWNTIPSDIVQKARLGDENDKPLLSSYQVNNALLQLHLSGKHDTKLTHEELRNWLHSGQVAVLRVSNNK